MRARRTRRITVVVDPVEHQEITRRAAAHGVTAASYLRATGLGRRDDPQAVAVDADRWWSHLPAGRRAQVFAWLTASAEQPDPQWPALFDVDASRGTGGHAILVEEGDQA